MPGCLSSGDADEFSRRRCSGRSENRIEDRSGTSCSSRRAQEDCWYHATRVRNVNRQSRPGKKKVVRSLDLPPAEPQWSPPAHRGTENEGSDKGGSRGGGGGAAPQKHNHTQTHHETRERNTQLGLLHSQPFLLHSRRLRRLYLQGWLCRYLSRGRDHERAGCVDVVHVIDC